MGTIPATISLPGSVVWLVVVGFSTFLLIYLTSDRQRIGRRATSMLVAILALGLACAYLLWTDMNTWTVIGTHPAESLMWGIAIGLVAEGLLLNAFSALIGWQFALGIHTLPSGSFLPWVLAVGASVAVVWADHLAYPETRTPLTLLAVTLAGGGLALGFVATGNVLTPMIGHALIHAVQIGRGGEIPPYQIWNPAHPAHSR